MPLRAKLTLYYTAILAVTLFLFGLALYLVLGNYLDREINRELIARAEDVKRSIRIVDRPLALQQVILPDVDAFSAPGIYLQVVDPEGVIIARSRNLGMQSLPISLREMGPGAADQGLFLTVSANRAKLRLYNLPLKLSGKVIGYLQVGSSLRPQSTVLAGLPWLLLLLGLITVAAAASLGFLMARAALRPIDNLTRVAEAIEEGTDLSRRVPQPSPRDEVGRLAATFNSMLQRLQAVYQSLEESNTAQKRFVADASHELRTPLTTIRGNIDLLLHMEEVDKATREEILSDLSNEAGRMARLLNNLLTLARADSGRSFPLSELDLESLVAEVARQAPHLGGASFAVKGLEQLQGLKVLGHPDYLKQLLLIFLDNAFRYTPAGGEVALAVRRREGEIGLAVLDTGPGIAAEHLPHLFERFYQVNPARSTRGTGLGLSIASWIAEQHKARLEVESQPGAGSVFTVWLPAFLPSS